MKVTGWVKALLPPSRPCDDLQRTWAASDEQVKVLDANLLLSDRQGRAKPSFFRTDSVNLNEHDYVRLSLMLRAQMMQDNPGIYGLAEAL